MEGMADKQNKMKDDRKEKIWRTAWSERRSGGGGGHKERNTKNRDGKKQMNRKVNKYERSSKKKN